jgi:hypothetical protein
MLAGEYLEKGRKLAERLSFPRRPTDRDAPLPRTGLHLWSLRPPQLIEYGYRKCS